MAHCEAGRLRCDAHVATGGLAFRTLGAMALRLADVIEQEEDGQSPTVAATARELLLHDCQGQLLATLRLSARFERPMRAALLAYRERTRRAAALGSEDSDDGRGRRR